MIEIVPPWNSPVRLKRDKIKEYDTRGRKTEDRIPCKVKNKQNERVGGCSGSIKII